MPTYSACIDDHISKRLEILITEDTTIEECLQKIEGIFKTLYPILIRRHKLQKMKQDGEDAITYMKQILVP